jgi:glycosyltransferase involved in cell wall biosynthesis
MAYGVASISFDCDTGPRDIIRHEVDGLLVKPGNSEEMAMALDCLMGDDLLRTQFSGRAVEVRERFTINKIASLWETLFAELLHEK